MERIVLGCGNFGGIGSAQELFGRGQSDEEAFAIMNAAWDLGITRFDTADAYGGGRSETAIGKWISSTGNRPTITTKTFAPMTAGADHGLARARVVRQLESSLERLGIERIDLYLAHAFDPDTPLEEIVGTFQSLAGIGLVGVWGVSNFDGSQLRTLFELARPTVVQNSLSLLDRGDEQDVLPLCVEFGVSYQAFSPLAGGWLTGKYRRGEELPPGSRMTLRPEPYQDLWNDRVFDALDAFEAEAVDRGVDCATLALAWLLSNPYVGSIVVGPRRPEHLAPVFSALDLHLSPEERSELAGLFP